MLFHYKACIASLAASTSLASAFAPHPQQHQRSHSYARSNAATFISITNTNPRRAAPSSSAATSSTLKSSSAPSSTTNAPSKLDSLLAQAQQCLTDKNADGAFATLAQAYGIDPTSTKISQMFEACLKLKVELAEANYYSWKNTLDNSVEKSVGLSEKELNDLFQDRMGLSSLFIDREYYDGAGLQLRKAVEEATFWLNYSLQSSSQESQNDERSISTSTPSATSATDLSSTRFQHWQPQIDRAQYLLYRTNAACCHWDTYFEDGDRVRQSLLRDISPSGQVACLLHPFDALKFPCISLELASNIARSYAHRALESVGAKVKEEEEEDDDDDTPGKPNQFQTRRVVTTNSNSNGRNDAQQQHQLQRKIKIGYISPDFTSRHPLAFLMQHVFQYHDKSQFDVNIYSVSNNDDPGPEVRAIRESSDQFTYLSPSSMSPLEMYKRIMEDELDVLVDLCGYAGTSIMTEIMASRCRLRQDYDRQHVQDNGDQSKASITQGFPIHVSYMGFPGSVGSSKVWDYSVFDPIVVPPEEKPFFYNEALVYMPHCYFVNSHKTVIGGKNDNGIMLADEDERRSLRAKYGIHPSAFVYCCHSRPDKIDPSTFRSWMRALIRIRSASSSSATKSSNIHHTHATTMAEEGDDNNHETVAVPSSPVLWVLRSGDEMEQNLRQWVRREFGNDAEDCLVFADVAERNEHLKRLGIADVFLDTPAYNAHTLGCDALYMGVPMISLLRDHEQQIYDGDTAKSTFDLESADVDLSDNIHEHYGSEMRSIATDKLASRVGASLLQAVGLRDELVYSDMDQYEDAMVRCALDAEWFSDVCQKLLDSKDSSPLFDTGRWVYNLEAAFRKMVEENLHGDDFPDVVVSDN